MRFPIAGHVGRPRRTVVIAVGDAAMIALFVALGELRHGGTVEAGLETFVQFGLAWAVVGVAAGVYAADALASPRRAAGYGMIAWAVAALVAQFLRLFLVQGARFQPTFVLVSIAVGGLLLGGWRYAAARFLR